MKIFLLEKMQTLNSSRNCPSVLKPEGWLQCLQEPATEPYEYHKPVFLKLWSAAVCQVVRYCPQAVSEEKVLQKLY
jgi:hypothetical protein